MTRFLAILFTLLGAGLVAAAFAVAGFILPAVLLFLFFVFWIFAFSRNWDWIHAPGLLLASGLAAFGLFLELESAYIFPGVFLSLAGWDLADFASRLRLASPEDDTRDLQRRHYLRLGLTLAIGVGLVLLAVNLQVRLPLGWMAALALLAAWGLGVLIKRLLQGN
ncbi:MAG: hypothetical protein HY781_07350 [Chloroflexi bacterium]|nr:hypothetical protein [Chloroflexota bacterium]